MADILYERILADGLVALLSFGTMKASGILCAYALLVASFDVTASDFIVADFGAKGDGLTKDTTAIQRAVDAAGAAGGGRVVLGRGTYLSGTIFLADNVELHLLRDARLLASPNLADYNAPDAFPQNYSAPKENWCGKHLLVAVERTNVALTGEGTVDGNGRAFFNDATPKFVGSAGWRRGAYTAKDLTGEGRPGQLIEFVECRNVRVRDVRMVDTPSWGCFLYGCENVEVGGLRVDSPLTHLNTDGIDVDSCRHVRIGECVIRTGDDAVAVRGSPKHLKDASRICEDVVISNCDFSVSACGVRIGVGTGVIRGVLVSNVVVRTAGTAFNLQAVYGQSSGVDISDVAVVDCRVADSARAISVTGKPERKVRDVRFADLLLEENDILPQEKMVRLAEAERVTFDRVRLQRTGCPARPLTETDVAAQNAEFKVD